MWFIPTNMTPEQQLVAYSVGLTDELPPKWNCDIHGSRLIGDWCSECDLEVNGFQV